MNTARFHSRRIHLMGIGGAGMSALVPLLRQAGALVSGCDLAEGPACRRLASEGVPIALGHDPAHVDGCDLVVHTSAVGPQHAELRAARAAGVEVIGRPTCLAELMRGSTTLAVAGSHGKTTTTWMVGHLLAEHGVDPLVMVGGSVAAIGGHGGRCGEGRIFVAEVDESDGGFRYVRPDVAIITNLESEHLRHYGSFAALCESFHDWLQDMGPTGVAIIDAETLDPRVSRGVAPRCVAVGLMAGEVHSADLRLDAEGSTFRVIRQGADAGEVRLMAPGQHNVHNALMAIAAVDAVAPGCDIGRLASWQPVGRRFTIHGRPRGIRVVEDYAHHPTELRVTIAAAALAGGRRHAIFQPHRPTRTSDCFDGFTAAFDEVAALVVLPVYAAGEDPIAGASGRDLAEAIAARRRAAGGDPALVQFVTNGDTALSFIAAHAVPGDTCLVLGAGDVGRLAPRLAERLAS
jgi:UDP-N-acetylmuramate--alanine ligase